MKIIMLGSGGVTGIPRPTCFCSVCKEARVKGIPYARTGTCLYEENGGVLFDMPVEIREQLNREKVRKINHVILTHWHPDHTLGIRTLMELNWNYDGAVSYGPVIPVYISKQQYKWFKEKSCGSFLDYYAKLGFIKIVWMEHKKPIVAGKTIVTPYLIEHTKGFYFHITDGERKIIYLPCEYHKVQIDQEISDIDIFIAHNLFWENKAVSSRKNSPTDEDTFEKMIKDAEQMGAKKIYLTHVEETFKLGYKKLNEQLKKYYPKIPVESGFDGMVI
jgi:phosphoribosyl 1,2-cyclic phosphate phosphodiesterase